MRPPLITSRTHGRALQRPLQAEAMPLGLDARTAVSPRGDAFVQGGWAYVDGLIEGPMMAKPTIPPASVNVEGLLEAPLIYFDAVPIVGRRGQVLNILLATHITEQTREKTTEDHLVAVANLRFPLAAATQLRDLLDKVILSTMTPPGQAN